MQEKRRFLPFAPDFIGEVQSPSDDLEPAREKMQKWMKNGVRLGWLILPDEQSVFIYRADGAVDKMQGFDKFILGEDVLPGFELDLSILL